MAGRAFATSTGRCPGRAGPRWFRAGRAPAYCYWLACGRAGARIVDETLGLSDGGADQGLRFGEDPFQVFCAAETLGVDLERLFGPRRARGEPAARGDDLQPADRSAIARR